MKLSAYKYLLFFFVLKTEIPCICACSRVAYVQTLSLLLFFSHFQTIYCEPLLSWLRQLSIKEIKPHMLIPYTFLYWENTFSSFGKQVIN